MKRLTVIILSLAFLAFGLLRAADAAPILWDSASGGNDHYYELISGTSTISWTDAKTQAEALQYNGVFGHLVTITSAEENAFVWSNLGVANYWIGAYQTSKDNEPAGNWAWVTGEAWAYANWHSGEPDNWFNPSTGLEEDYAAFDWRADGTWADLDQPGIPNFTKGYIVEYASVPVPGAIWLLGSGLACLLGIGRKLKVS